MRNIRFAVVLAASVLSVALSAQPKSMAEVLASAKPSDWRALDPAHTLYLELESGRVVMELAPQFAPRLVTNLETLIREKYFDGTAIVRSQDNYVVQWSDPDQKRSLGTAKKTSSPEFERSAKGLEFTALPNVDAYAPQTGFVDGFPTARDSKGGRAWLVHCYGMLGVGREDDVNSGNGTELYVVIGHAPRHLDRNVALVGRVIQGMELLSVLPRGKAPMGYYEKPEQRTSILSIRLAADVPESERSHLEILRTDTKIFTDLIESRRNRRDAWFKLPAGRIDICNVPIVVRPKAATP